MDATSSRDDSASAWCAAVDLASHVAAGGHLPSVASRVLLEPGEVLHADVPAQGWRFAGADVPYAEPRAVAIGGPVIGRDSVCAGMRLSVRVDHVVRRFITKKIKKYH